jgi:microcystin-dependent protein
MATYGTPTTNYSLPKLDGSSDRTDVDAGIQALADGVDAVMAGRGSGALGSRPATAPDGFIYRTTDTGQVFLSTGSAWIELGVSPWQPGDLKYSTLTTAPAGWLLCDGSPVLRATYTALFSAIGTTFGPGNGSTTFNLPDARARALLMPDGTAARMVGPDARGGAGGEETHVLTVGEMPNHRHATFETTAVAQGGATWTLGLVSTQAAGTVSGETSAVGGDGAHQNMPPYLVVGSVLIKT